MKYAANAADVISSHYLILGLSHVLGNGATSTSHFLGADRVIPIGQRRVSAEVNLAHLRVRDGLALFIMLVC